MDNRLKHQALILPKCPHCGVDTPHLPKLTGIETHDAKGTRKLWGFFGCTRCGNIVSAVAANAEAKVDRWYPSGMGAVSVDIPERPRAYLAQARDSLASPAGAVMLAASSVDAMLKAKGFVDGSLYTRIKKGADDGLITPGMAEWANDVRLDANDIRHDDEGSPLPDEDQARKCIDFAMALGDFLFVLPARVERGRVAAAAISETVSPAPLPAA